MDFNRLIFGIFFILIGISIRYETHEGGAEFGAKLVGVIPGDFPERKGLAGGFLP